MGDLYSDMRLEDFISKFSAIEAIDIENGKKVQPYLQNPLKYQRTVVVKGVKSLVSALKISQTDTVQDIMSELLDQSIVSYEEIPHIAQCCLAMVPVVLGKQSLVCSIDVDDEWFTFQVYKNTFNKALKSKGKPEPLLFSNLEKTYDTIYKISGMLKTKKGYKFEPTEHNKEQVSAIVRCARDENEFLGVFYKYILSPALRIE
jgi:hypothetical protein